MKLLDSPGGKNVHFFWKPDLKPVISVNDGEIFSVAVPDSSMGNIGPDSTLKEIKSMDLQNFDGAVGPVKIEGAEPGDTLSVEILDISLSEYGWSAILDSIGLLRGRFRERLVHWRIGEEFCWSTDDFLKGVRIPRRPFPGVIGTAPSSGQYGMIPPQYFGGNMDNPLLSTGARLYLPVSVNGAMLSFGDMHAAQGYGEVCGTAIETSGTMTVRVKLLKKEMIDFPRAMAPSYNVPESTVTMGISPDLKDACIIALKEMMDDLRRTEGLTEEECYVLCSVAGNLYISEVVDEPNYVVSITIPKNIFVH